MLRLRSVVGLVALLLVHACGSDATGLRTSPTLTGTWQMAQFSIGGQYQGATFSCSLVGMTITLAQAADSLSGTHSAGTFTCSVGGQTQSQALDPGQVRGAVAGTQITLRIDAGEPLTGTWAGDRIAGTFALDVPGYGSFPGSFLLTR